MNKTKPKRKPWRMSRTERGFSVMEFIDRYDQKCSLQKSSLASEDAIWLGVSNSGPQMPGPKGQYNEDVNDRMHLTQEMVKKLLPHLERFAETGELR